MKIPRYIKLDQKELNCFWHPQFYSSIAPMNVATKSSSFLRIPFYSENFRDVAIFDQENGDYFKCDNIEYDSIGEYSATKIHFFPGGKKIVKKFPPIFHFQGWKSFLICTFLVLFWQK